MRRFVAFAAMFPVLFPCGLAVAAVQDATPPAAKLASAPAACRVEPRAIPLYEALALLPTGTPSPDAAGTPDTPATSPTDSQADPLTVAAVTATIRELVACENAGDFRRFFALVTDDYLGGFFAKVAEIANALRLPPALAVLTFTGGSPMPRAEQVWIEVLSVEDVRVLPDGRVGAVVVARDPTEEPEVTTSYVVFERVGDRWLLDTGWELPTAAIAGALAP